MLTKVSVGICADYTSALDKLAPSETASSKGTFGSVQEYASSTAQAAADQAQRLKDAAAQAVNSSGANTGDVQGSAKSTVQVHICVLPYLSVRLLAFCLAESLWLHS